MCKVKLRKKPITGGRDSLFLDIYPPVPNPDNGKLTRKHYLSLFTYKRPKTELERFHNNETMELARTVAAKRQIDVQNLRFDFLSQRMMKGDFVEFFEEQKLRRKGSNLENWRMAILYFKAFAGEQFLFPQLNETFSEEYADYLLSAPGIGRTGKKISTNTAVSYFAKFKATLKQAFKKRFIPIDLGSIIDSITPKDTHREFLFMDELQKMADAECTSDVIKRASMFSALTGLRFSDICTLDWGEVRGNKGNYSIHFSVDKTDSAEYLPIPDQAFDLLGPRTLGLVFRELNIITLLRFFQYG